jgi:DNA-binding transcriptional LysR family regulator
VVCLLAGELVVVDSAKMTFHQLRIFKAVAHHLSVTRAATELHLSQPCISTQLKLLEIEFGVELHRRTGRGVTLTDEGVVFLRTIRPIVRQADELKNIFTVRTDPKTVILQVASTQNTGVSLLPEVLKDFKKIHPQINLSLRTAQSRVVEQLVLNEEVEIGIVTDPSYNPKLITQPFSWEEVVAVVAPAHPLAKKGELSHKELSKAPCLVRMGGIILKELQKTGVKLNIAVQAESSEPLKAAVQSGLGVGFFYRSTVEAGLKDGQFKAIRISGLEQIAIRSVLVTLANKPLLPHARDFMNLLSQRVPKSPAECQIHS